MKLLVDIGNSTHHIIGCPSEPPVFTVVFENKIASCQLNFDDLYAQLHSLPLKVIIIASVVPQDVIFWQDMAQRLNIPFHIIRYHDNFSFKINIPSPEMIGIDRLLALEGGLGHDSQNDILVIDSGTAITCDFLSKDRIFSGGMILAGINMMRQALHEKTACLPLVIQDYQTIPPLQGDNTQTAIQAGLYWGQIALIEGLIGLFKTTYPAIITIATGGGLGFCHDNVKSLDYYDAYLLIKGIFSLSHKLKMDL